VLKEQLRGRRLRLTDKAFVRFDESCSPRSCWSNFVSTIACRSQPSIATARSTRRFSDSATSSAAGAMARRRLNSCTLRVQPTHEDDGQDVTHVGHARGA
jgi:hypothetical protein